MPYQGAARASFPLNRAARVGRRSRGGLSSSPTARSKVLRLAVTQPPPITAADATALRKLALWRHALYARSWRADGRERGADGLKFSSTITGARISSAARLREAAGADLEGGALRVRALPHRTANRRHSQSVRWFAMAPAGSRRRQDCGSGEENESSQRTPSARRALRLSAGPRERPARQLGTASASTAQAHRSAARALFCPRASSRRYLRSPRPGVRAAPGFADARCYAARLIRTRRMFLELILGFREARCSRRRARLLRRAGRCVPTQTAVRRVRTRVLRLRGTVPGRVGDTPSSMISCRAVAGHRARRPSRDPQHTATPRVGLHASTDSAMAAIQISASRSLAVHVRCSRRAPLRRGSERLGMDARRVAPPPSDGLAPAHRPPAAATGASAPVCQLRPHQSHTPGRASVQCPRRRRAWPDWGRRECASGGPAAAPPAAAPGSLAEVVALFLIPEGPSRQQACAGAAFYISGRGAGPRAHRARMVAPNG